MPRLVILLASCVCLVLAASAALAQTGGTGIGIQLLEAPRELADNPRAQLYIIDEVDPGTSFTRRIRVSNNTDGPQRVELYPVQASTRGGWTVDADRARNELASWMTVEPSEASLGAGEVIEATVTVRVPQDARPGEHYAAVIAAGPPSDEGGPISVISRVGIRAYLFVLGEEPPVVDFEVDTLVAARDDEGNPYVLIGVTNTGERAIDLNGQLVLTEGPGSLSAGPFPVTVPRTVGPGDRGDVRVHLAPQLPAGPWLARADLVSGLTERSAQATIVFPDAAGESSDPVEATEVPLLRDRGFLLPVAVALVIVALVGLALFWWYVVRDRGVAVAQKAASKVKAGK